MADVGQSMIDGKEVIVAGEVPDRRTKHTLTQISNYEFVLFGGIKDTGVTNILKYTPGFKQTFEWIKVSESGEVPCHRYDHGACAVDWNRMVVYGGMLSNNQILASDELFLLRYSQEDKEITWSIIRTAGG